MLPAGIGSEYTQQEKSASRRADLSRTSAGRGIVRFENELGAGRASAISILSPAQRNAILTCLLYTSPSPRDKRQSRMPSSA